MAYVNPLASGLAIYSPAHYSEDQSGLGGGQPAEVVDPTTTTGYSGPLSGSQFAGEPAAVWVGMLALLFVVGWYGRHVDTLGGEIPKDIRVGFYNWLTVGIMAATFFLLGKVVFTKYPIPGVTSFFQAL
jgi:hypothetical protein